MGMMGAGRKMTDLGPLIHRLGYESEKEMIEELLKKHTQREVAKICGLSTGSISNRIAALGVEYVRHKRQESGVRSQESEVRSQEPEDRSQESGVRSQELEDGSKESGARSEEIVERVCTKYRVVSANSPVLLAEAVNSLVLQGFRPCGGVAVAGTGGYFLQAVMEWRFRPI